MARARHGYLQRHLCRYCGAQLNTLQGLRSHFKQSKVCQSARTKSLNEMSAKELRRQREATRKGARVAADPDEMPNNKDVEVIAYDFNEEITHDDGVRTHNSSNIEIENETRTHAVAAMEPVNTVKYPGNCAEKYGVCENRWEILIETVGEDKQWGGFADEEEWELARWLVKSNASQRDIDNFAKLSIVSKRAGTLYVPLSHPPYSLHPHRFYT